MTLLKQKILLIEDNEDLQKINQKALEMSGYETLTVSTLKKGQDFLRKNKVDLILLDITMPDGNSIDFCRELRGESNVPVLFLGTLEKNIDIISALTAGGDDYLTAPYGLDLLTAKVEALLRRVSFESKNESYISGSFKIDFLGRHIYYCNEEIYLKPREYAVLEFLFKNRQRFVSTKEIYSTVWNMQAAPDTRTVKTHIYSLRKKLKIYPDIPFIIDWRKGKGYRYIEK